MNLLFSCIGKRGYIADFFRRSLDPADRIIGTGNSRWTPGFQACDAAFLMPDIHDDDYVPAVLELCERQQIDALLSFNDQDVYRLARFRAELRRRGVVPLLPSAEVAEITYDKYRTFCFLSSQGIPTPRTALMLDDGMNFHYPLYVKPRCGSGSHETFIARNESELAFFFNYRPDMIIQEAVVGEELDIELCGDLDGRPVGLCTWKKYASRLGETEMAETFQEEAVTDFALQLGEVLLATGPIDIDVIRDGESLMVIEANTRFGGGYPASHLAGADFPRLLIDLVRHGNTQPNFLFTPGVVMMKRLEPIGGGADAFFRDQLRVL